MCLGHIIGRILEKGHRFKLIMGIKGPVVSVIIPVYNVEKYLEYCLQSVFAQTYNKLEIILVDDGSTDSSGKMCDDFANSDERVKVVHTVNGGLSSARNIGIKESTGEFITFLDSDDYIRKDYVKKLSDIMIHDDSDIVVGAYKKVYTDIDFLIIEESFGIRQYDGREFSFEMLSQKLPIYAHGKLYRRELFEEIEFPEGRWYEDIPTLWKVSKLVKKASSIENKLYFYRQREGSIVNVKFALQRMDQLYFAEEIFAEVMNDNKFRTAAGARCFFSAVDTYFMVDPTHVEEEKYLKESIKKYRKYVINNPETNYGIKVLALLSFLRLDLVKKLGIIYKEINFRKIEKAAVDNIS